MAAGQAVKSMKMSVLDLLLSMRNTCINSDLDLIVKFDSSRRNTQIKDVFPWNIFDIINETISISLNHPNQRKNDEKPRNKKKPKQLIGSEFPRVGKATVEQRVGLETTNQSKRVG